ncbi:hypothetical protein Y032_0007g3342 [Ancylostoma ceylanicum]|uniref:Uncharacterized protein n=1 Tax=Ancylostoma ceylanicum TaxID=53326 RepID=A0A016VM30_9BILA|nr:hypothetical protein Y032_0007g3342 [Ancylostoma ceylanicum]
MKIFERIADLYKSVLIPVLPEKCENGHADFCLTFEKLSMLAKGHLRCDPVPDLAKIAMSPETYEYMQIL